jgi:adhesin HecA-like repeat protein
MKRKISYLVLFSFVYQIFYPTLVLAMEFERLGVEPPALKHCPGKFDWTSYNRGVKESGLFEPVWAESTLKSPEGGPNYHFLSQEFLKDTFGTFLTSSGRSIPIESQVNLTPLGVNWTQSGFDMLFDFSGNLHVNCTSDSIERSIFEITNTYGAIVFSGGRNLDQLKAEAQQIIFTGIWRIRNLESQTINSLIILENGELEADSVDVIRGNLQNQGKFELGGQLRANGNSIYNLGRLYFGGDRSSSFTPLNTSWEEYDISRVSIFANTGEILGLGATIDSEVFTSKGTLELEGLLALRAGFMLQNHNRMSAGEVRIFGGEGFLNKGQIEASDKALIYVQSNRGLGKVKAPRTTINTSHSLLLNEESELEGLVTVEGEGHTAAFNLRRSIERLMLNSRGVTLGGNIRRELEMLQVGGYVKELAFLDSAHIDCGMFRIEASESEAAPWINEGDILSPTTVIRRHNFTNQGEIKVETFEAAMPQFINRGTLQSKQSAQFDIEQFQNYGVTVWDAGAEGTIEHFDNTGTLRTSGVTRIHGTTFVNRKLLESSGAIDWWVETFTNEARGRVYVREFWFKPTRQLINFGLLRLTISDLTSRSILNLGHFEKTDDLSTDREKVPVIKEVAKKETSFNRNTIENRNVFVSNVKGYPVKKYEAIRGSNFTFPSRVLAGTAITSSAEKFDRLINSGHMTWHEIPNVNNITNTGKLRFTGSSWTWLTEIVNSGILEFSRSGTINFQKLITTDDSQVIAPAGIELKQTYGLEPLFLKGLFDLGDQPSSLEACHKKGFLNQATIVSRGGKLLIKSPFENRGRLQVHTLDLGSIPLVDGQRQFVNRGTVMAKSLANSSEPLTIINGSSDIHDSVFLVAPASRSYRTTVPLNIVLQNWAEVVLENEAYHLAEVETFGMGITKISKATLKAKKIKTAREGTVFLQEGRIEEATDAETYENNGILHLGDRNSSLVWRRFLGRAGEIESPENLYVDVREVGAPKRWSAPYDWDVWDSARVHIPGWKLGEHEGLGKLATPKMLIIDTLPGWVSVAAYIETFHPHWQSNGLWRLYGDTYTAGKDLQIPRAVEVVLSQDFTNRKYRQQFERLGIKSRDLLLGTSNEDMGHIGTLPVAGSVASSRANALTIECTGKVDARFGQISSRGNTSVRANGTVQLGNRLISPTKRTNHDGYCGGGGHMHRENDFYVPNLAYISSGNELLINTTDVIEASYGTVYSHGAARINASRLDSRDGVFVFNSGVRFQIPYFSLYCADSVWTDWSSWPGCLCNPCRDSKIPSDGASISVLNGDCHFDELRDFYLRSSSLKVAGDVFFNGIHSGNRPNSAFRMTRGRGYTGCHCGTCPVFTERDVGKISEFVAGGVITFDIGGIFTDGSISGGGIRVSVTAMEARNASGRRAEAPSAGMRVEMDFPSIGALMHSSMLDLERRCLALEGDDSIKTVKRDELGFLRRDKQAETLPPDPREFLRMPMSPILMQMAFMNILSNVAGRLSINGMSGHTLLNRLFQNGRRRAQEHGGFLTDETMAASSEALILAELAPKAVDLDGTLKLHVFIPAELINHRAQESGSMVALDNELIVHASESYTGTDNTMAGAKKVEIKSRDVRMNRSQVRRHYTTGDTTIDQAISGDGHAVEVGAGGSVVIEGSHSVRGTAATFKGGEGSTLEVSAGAGGVKLDAAVDHVTVTTVTHDEDDDWLGGSSRDEVHSTTTQTAHGNRVEGFKSAAFKSKGGNVDIALPLIDVGLDGIALFEGVHTSLRSVVTSDSEYHSVSTSDSGLLGGTDRTWNYGSRRDTAHKGHVIGHTIFRGQTATSQADHIGDFSDETTRGTRMEPTFVETSSHSYHDRSSWKGDAAASASSRERTPIMPITSGGKFSNAKPEGVKAEPGAETVLRAAAYKESTLAHDVSVRGAEREAEAHTHAESSGSRGLQPPSLPSIREAGCGDTRAEKVASALETIASTLGHVNTAAKIYAGDYSSPLGVARLVGELFCNLSHSHQESRTDYHVLEDMPGVAEFGATRVADGGIQRVTVHGKATFDGIKGGDIGEMKTGPLRTSETSHMEAHGETSSCNPFSGSIGHSHFSARGDSHMRQELPSIIEILDDVEGRLGHLDLDAGIITGKGKIRVSKVTIRAPEREETSEEHMRQTGWNFNVMSAATLLTGGGAVGPLYKAMGIGAQGARMLAGLNLMSVTNKRHDKYEHHYVVGRVDDAIGEDIDLEEVEEMYARGGGELPRFNRAAVSSVVFDHVQDQHTHREVRRTFGETLRVVQAGVSVVQAADSLSSSLRRVQIIREEKAKLRAAGYTGDIDDQARAQADERILREAALIEEATQEGLEETPETASTPEDGEKRSKEGDPLIEEVDPSSIPEATSGGKRSQAAAEETYGDDDDDGIETFDADAGVWTSGPRRGEGKGRSTTRGSKASGREPTYGQTPIEWVAAEPEAEPSPYERGRQLHVDRGLSDWKVRNGRSPSPRTRRNLTEFFDSDFDRRQHQQQYVEGLLSGYMLFAPGLAAATDYVQGKTEFREAVGEAAFDIGVTILGGKVIGAGVRGISQGARMVSQAAAKGVARASAKVGGRGVHRGARVVRTPGEGMTPMTGATTSRPAASGAGGTAVRGEPVRSAVNPHGNSKSYVGETHVYVVRDIESGTVYKVGESMQGVNKLGQSKRAEAQARRLRREIGRDFDTEVRRTFTTKAEARDWETRLIGRLRQTHGADKLPGNKGVH